MKATVRRVVHLGIDGGSFRVMDALADRGLLPEFVALREAGGWAVLRSTTPWFTVPAWISLMTGVPAERHGLIYWTAMAAHDYWDRSGPAGRFVASTDIRYPTIFRLLSNAGIRIASLNMPVTFPPPDVNGVIVSGFLAPSDPAKVAHPPDFLGRYPDYRVDLEEGPGSGPVKTRTDAQVAEYAAEVETMAKARHRVFLDLLREDFGLASVVYVGADRLSHVAWPQVEAVTCGVGASVGERAVEAYYTTLDRLIGETRRAAPDSVFVVTSDHGQGPPPPRTFAPNAWLRERGWLVVQSQGARRASHLVAWPGLRRKVWAVYRTLRNVPRGSTPFADWDKTVAYGIPMPHCRVLGIAVRGDASRQRQIAEALLELTDTETGLKPVERVLFASDFCADQARATYPELLALLAPEYGAVSSIDGQITRASEAGPSGYHEPNGILLAAGAGVAPGEHSEASICDIAPTVLTLLGVLPPDHMRGDAIPWLGDAPDALIPVRAQAETVIGAELTEGEEERIAEHLRDLGYIE